MRKSQKEQKGTNMRIIAIGDIVGWPGVKTFSRLIGGVKRLYAADMVIVNGENANALGITPAQASELFSAGADVITLGNHAWACRDIIPYIDRKPALIRPYNTLAPHPGKGYVIRNAGGMRVCVVNLLGRAMMDISPDNPFYAIDRLLDEVKDRADIVVVDFHAEATSEKLAMLHYLAGRVAVLYGTHTHVQTADERVFQGTGYITDLGMTGPRDGVLGVKPRGSIAGFRGEIREKYETADGPTEMRGAVFELTADGRCRSVERIAIE